MPADPYATLGIARDATPQQVKRAYRQQAKRYHPDLHPGPEAVVRMAGINRAHELLSDAGRRAAWDAAHPPQVRRPGPGPVPPARPTASGGPAGTGGPDPASRDRAAPEPPLEAALAFVLTFGKFRWRTLGYVAAVEPGYIAWIVRTIDDRPNVTRNARVVLAHLERQGWRDTPRPPRARGTAASSGPTSREGPAARPRSEPQSEPRVTPPPPGAAAEPAWNVTRDRHRRPAGSRATGFRAGRDAVVEVVVVVVLLVIGWSLVQGVLRGPQPGDIVCEVFDPRIGDCVVESVYEGP